MQAFTLDADGWLGPAHHYRSPHCDERPPGAQAELLVIHNISLPRGQFGGPHIADLFTGRIDVHADPSFAELRPLRVSAHFLIRRDGSVLQFVPTSLRAWHAGVSQFQGRAACNDFSIGIELEGSDDVAFSPAQYATLAPLTAALLQRHPLHAVLGHEHIAPGRKTDPGPFFQWDQYGAALAQLVPAHRALGIGANLTDVKSLLEKK